MSFSVTLRVQTSDNNEAIRLKIEMNREKRYIYFDSETFCAQEWDFFINELQRGTSENPLALFCETGAIVYYSSHELVLLYSFNEDSSETTDSEVLPIAVNSNQILGNLQEIRDFLAVTQNSQAKLLQGKN